LCEFGKLQFGLENARKRGELQRFRVWKAGIQRIQSFYGFWRLR